MALVPVYPTTRTAMASVVELAETPVSREVLRLMAPSMTGVLGVDRGRSKLKMFTTRDVLPYDLACGLVYRGQYSFNLPRFYIHRTIDRSRSHIGPASPDRYHTVSMTV